MAAIGELVPDEIHPRSLDSTTGWTVTNPLCFMKMPMMTYTKEIAPRPILLVAGSEAHSRYFSEDAFAAAAEPKEMPITGGADHVGLYDRTDVILLTNWRRSSGRDLDA